MYVTMTGDVKILVFKSLLPKEIIYSKAASPVLVKVVKSRHVGYSFGTSTESCDIPRDGIRAVCKQRTSTPQGLEAHFGKVLRPLTNLSRC